MVAQPAIQEQLRQHGKRTSRECLIDEWLLPVKCLNRRAAGQRVFSDLGIDDLGKKLAHCS